MVKARPHIFGLVLLAEESTEPSVIQRLTERMAALEQADRATAPPQNCRASSQVDP